jgi:hypothetical protein
MSALVDEITLRIRCADAAANEVKAVVDPIIEAHGAVTRRGAFSNPDNTDGAPELTSTIEGDPSDRRYHARARFVDRGAWRVLLEAIRGELWLKNLADQADVQCSVIRDDGEVLGSRDIQALPFPSSPRQAPFQISWHEDGPPLRAAVRVFFVDAAVPTTVDSVTQFLGDWQRLIRAYRPPHEPEVPFGGAIPTEALWAQPYAVELALDAFLADESVFHPIVNFACWLQRRRVAIEELVIE